VKLTYLIVWIACHDISHGSPDLAVFGREDADRPLSHLVWWGPVCVGNNGLKVGEELALGQAGPMVGIENLFRGFSYQKGMH
jgi:hypothetical protein